MTTTPIIQHTSGNQAYLLDALLAASPDLVLIKDGQGRWQQLSQAGAQLYGLEGKTWQNKTEPELASMVHTALSDSFHACQTSDADAWQAGHPIRLEEIIPDADGHQRVFDIIKSPLFDEQKQRRALVIIGRDITRAKELHTRLEQERSLFVSGPVVIFNWNAQDGWPVSYVSPNVLDQTGYTPEDFLSGRISFSSLIHPDDLQRISSEVSHYSLNGPDRYEQEYRLRLKNGNWHWFYDFTHIIRDAQGQVSQYHGYLLDITDSKNSQEIIANLSQHDPLTGLPNRHALSSIHPHALNQRMALLHIDLDHFKLINETLGYAVGDRLIQRMAERLQSLTRDHDVLARPGGDEFLLLMADIAHADDAAQMAQRILNLLHQPFYIDSHELLPTLSVGIALLPDDALDLPLLQQKADAAMYAAKQAGRNGFHFYTENMDTLIRERLRIERALRQALERHELSLHYQPQVDACTGAIVGAEALLRWHSHDLGQVSPMRFIPVAEETGLIIPIGEWVLQQACQQAKRWHDLGVGIRIAVNLSSLQFRRTDIADTVARTLDETGLPPQLLELELTESLLVEDAESARGILARLAALGIQLSIDDFGTGYSSLSYLKKFSVHKLKIDQSFVRDLAVDPDDAAIVRAVIQLGHSLGLTVIAEGVETEEQLHHLQSLSCEEAQGYFFARPIPAQDMEHLLQTSEMGGIMCFAPGAADHQ